MDFHLLFTQRIAALRELRRQTGTDRLGAPEIDPANAIESQGSGAKINATVRWGTRSAFRWIGSFRLRLAGMGRA
jgi:hypothetical protein